MGQRTYNEMIQQLADILEERTSSVTIQSSVRGEYGEFTDYLATITTVDEARGLNILATGISSYSVGECLNNLLDEVDDINGEASKANG